MHLVRLAITFMVLALPVSASVASAQSPIRFGVLSIAPPSRIYLKWQPFVDYVSNELGQPIEIVVPRGFKKMKQAAEKLGRPRAAALVADKVIAIAGKK